jgi:hypothetical protein
MVARCQCTRCKGKFQRSELTVYKGRLLCEHCAGDEAMWDSIADQERKLDAYLSAQEEGY